MRNQEYILNHMAGIFHTGIFCQQKDQLISYEENPEYNPLYNNEALRLKLTCNSEMQKEPVIIMDDFHTFYICIKRGNIYYMMGPLSTRVMSRVDRH